VDTGCSGGQKPRRRAAAARLHVIELRGPRSWAGARDGPARAGWPELGRTSALCARELKQAGRWRGPHTREAKRSRGRAGPQTRQAGAGAPGKNLGRERAERERGLISLLFISFLFLSIFCFYSL
jgi:hypothetical protein